MITQREHALNNSRKATAAAKMAKLDAFASTHDTSKMTQKEIAAATGLTIHAVVYWRERDKYARSLQPVEQAEPKPVGPKPGRLFFVDGNNLCIVNPPAPTKMKAWTN